MSGDCSIRVSFHCLETREDRGEWLVGRRGGDQVVALPDVGMEAVRLLATGMTVADTRSQLHATSGRDIDVQNFVERLASAGLVASIGSVRFPAPRQVVSLARVQPHHVGWLLSPRVHAFALLVPLIGLATAVAQPGVLPGWDSLMWSEYGTFTVLLQFAIAWALIAIHECAHLLTARASGVYGRVRLGTRLQFLVAQTEVSGIWLKNRRERLTVYLSGITIDGMICGGCLIARGMGAESFLLPLVALTLFFALTNQFLIFMRTDIYFIFQDVTGCRNLFSDTGRYLLHLTKRAIGRRTSNPLREIPTAERRWVMAYSAGMVVGSGACLVIGLQVFTQFSLPMLDRSIAQVVHSPNTLARLDALVTVLILVGLHALWACLWWRRHGRHVRRAGRSVHGRLSRVGGKT